MLAFDGKIVLVSGGSRGIGAATVSLFSKLGAAVAFNYNKQLQAAEKLAEDCSRYGGEVFYDECDVRDFREVKSFIHKVLEHFGKIDILVNNAGIWEHAPITNMSVDHWRNTMQTNLDSVFYFTRLVVQQMLEKRIRGQVINVASTAAQRGEAEYAHYAASKGAIISFTKSLASELGAHGIRVNCVAPGWVETDMSREALKNNYDAIVADIPLGFVAKPEDIANAIIFLASDMARYIHGEVLNVNGGNVLCG